LTTIYDFSIDLACALLKDAIFVVLWEEDRGMGCSVVLWMRKE